MKPTQVLASILWMTSAAVSAQALNVLVYDYANLTAQQTAGMLDIARLLLEKPGISVSWTICRGVSATPASAESCARELGGNDYVLRIQPGKAAAGTGRTIALASAVVGAEGGRYVSILYGTVQPEAAEKHISASTLLGYTLAHEIGHCLLGPVHSSRGVMQANWSRRDAQDMEQLRVSFSRGEAERMVASLSERLSGQTGGHVPGVLPK